MIILTINSTLIEKIRKTLFHNYKIIKRLDKV